MLYFYNTATSCFITDIDTKFEKLTLQFSNNLQ